LGELQRRAEHAFSNSIGDRSRRTYGVGVRHWDEFRAAYLVPDLGTGGDDEGNVAAFLAYLVTVVRVAPQTADSYLSHVLKSAVASRNLTSTEQIRTLYNRGVIRGLKRSYDEANPARERTRVPLTYPLVVGAAKTVDNVIGDKTDKLALKAAIGLAYGLSLRPGEFLKMSGVSQRKPQEQALASHAFLWWDGKAYPVTDPQRFPAGPAQFFTPRVDFLKQDHTGKGMPWLLHRTRANSRA